LNEHLCTGLKRCLLVFLNAFALFFVRAYGCSTGLCRRTLFISLPLVALLAVAFYLSTALAVVQRPLIFKNL